MTHAQKRNHWNRKAMAYAFIVPSLLIVGIVVVFPIVYTGIISFTNMSLYHWSDYSFVGWKNYAKTLLATNSAFWGALGTTVIWTVANMVLQIGAGFFIALALNAKGLKGRRVYKTLLMVPWAMPSYVSILIWRVGIYNTQFGVLNKFLGLMGLGRINYLASNVPAFFSCLLLNLWMALPFMITMMDGAMQSVDRSLYDSAQMDGCGYLRAQWEVTVPAISRIMMPAVVMTTFTTFKQFDIVYLLTMQKGSLTGSTLQTIITYAHSQAFVTNNYGLSSAVSIVIFFIIIAFFLALNRSNRSLREEK